MTTITDFLPEKMKETISQRVRECNFASPEAYIEDLIRRDSNYEPISAELEAKLLEAADGPFLELPNNFWKLRAEKILRGEKIEPV